MDATGGAPIAGATVGAASPSGRYAGKTDSRGFYSFTGVSPDSYTVSFELTGYEPSSSSGIVVFADQVTTVNAKLQRGLKQIGSATARAAGGAFQPTQTVDSYTVTGQQMKTIEGKSYTTDQASLISRLPGAQLDTSGYPVLRGGRQDEEGYQYDGVEQTSAFLGLSINSLRMNSSVSQLQLTPGPGDASTGNAGTGVVNLVAKRGTYPAFASLDLEALAQPYGHQLGLEYGFATQDGRFSNYITFLGSRAGVQYGSRGSSATDLGVATFYKPSFLIANDFVDNAVFKFGKNNAQSIQLLYQNQQYDQIGTYGSNALDFASADSFTNFIAPAITGLTQAQFAHFISLYPGQQNVNQPLGGQGALNFLNASHTIKLQYTNNLNASTFLTFRAYQSQGDLITSGPYRQAGITLLSIDKTEGGTLDGFALDVTKQLGAKNLLKIGADYKTNIPNLHFVDTVDSIYVYAGLTGDGSSEVWDFVNPSNPNPDLANCAIDPAALAGTGRSYCGYLTKYLGPNPGPVTAYHEASTTLRQDHSFYISDTYSPTANLRVNAGLRFDGSHYGFPSTAGCSSLTADTCLYAQTGSKNGVPFTTVPNDAQNPLIIEPRLGVALQITPNDAVRAFFGRSVEFAPINAVDQQIAAAPFAAYAGIPSYDSLGAVNAGVAPGTPFPSMKCGVRLDRLCQNYADQLIWAAEVATTGVPIQPVLPETFTNIDFSYSHQFAGNVAVRVTPFYRRGYNALASVSQPLLSPTTGLVIVDPATGQPAYGGATQTNLGMEKTTGIEFQLTKDTRYGLSGQISATYINEFSNVIPTTLSEDLLPNIPPASLALGNLYRVGFISPFVATAALAYQTRTGFRINPVINYNIGYPIGAGNLTATSVNGPYYNVPNTNGSGANSVNGVAGSPNYIDPQNPGTLFKPNINASRGSPEKSSAGGALTGSNLTTDISFEYTNPKGKAKSTFGLLVTNLFNVLFNGTSYAYNDRYQPVTTGVSGPQTGYSAFPIQFPGKGVSTYPAAAYGNQPYRILFNLPPTTLRFYYQLAL